MVEVPATDWSKEQPSDDRLDKDVIADINALKAEDEPLEHDVPHDEIEAEAV
jgi:hypothetical protein